MSWDEAFASHYDPGLTTAEPSSGLRRRSGRTSASPGMPSPLTTRLPRVSMAFLRKSLYPIPSGMLWATIGLI
jgi:hypothetical protein